MLFFAVFCGFLAENQREHMVEHRQEKQYMKLMREDLMADTVQLRKSLADIESSVSNIDSALTYLVGLGTTTENVKEAYRFTSDALKRIPVVFTDRTLTQLKNSGRMRIVRSQKVMDALSYYWNHIEVIRVSLDRHNHYRSMGRDLEIRIFNLAKDFLKDHRFMTSHSGETKVATTNQSLITEYANTFTYCGVVLGQAAVQLIQQQDLATQLIRLIQDEYHLE